MLYVKLVRIDCMALEQMSFENVGDGRTDGRTKERTVDVLFFVL